MFQRLKGKVAVVTGASKGIGAAIAKGLGAAGAAVVVNYASSKEGAERVVAEVTGKGGRAVAVQADVAKQADIRRLFAEAKDARSIGRTSARPPPRSISSATACPRTRSRAPRMTSAPSRASARAVSRPIPDVAPVTRTTLSGVVASGRGTAGSYARRRPSGHDRPQGADERPRPADEGRSRRGCA